MSSVKCRFKYTKFYNKENKFCINDYLTLDKKILTAKGCCLTPYSDPNLIVTLNGDWKLYKGNDVLDVKEVIEEMNETPESFIAYLKVNFRGVGEATAKKIFSKTGADLEKFQEMLQDEYLFGKVVGKKTANSIIQQNQEKKTDKNLFDLLFHAAISNNKIREIETTYGNEAYY